MYPEIVASSNPLVAHMSYYSGISILVNKSQEELQCSKIKSGKLGPVTLDGQFKVSTLNNKMVHLLMLLTALILPSTKTHSTPMKKISTYLQLEMIMVKLLSIITPLWLKTPSMLKAEDILVMLLQSGGPKMINISHLLEERISVLWSGKYKKIHPVINKELQKKKWPRKNIDTLFSFHLLLLNSN